MEFFDPGSFYHVVFLCMAFQLLYFRLIDVSLSVVAELREEKYFSFAVPEIRMVNDIFEHEFS